MRHITVATLAVLAASSAASANCVPPMQTLFACTFENTNSRVEFCHEILEEQTSNSSSTPGDAKSYSFARGVEPTELYFTPTTTFFNVIDANVVDQKIYGHEATKFLVTGYQNSDYIYAALLSVDDDYYNGFYGAEFRIFKNTTDFDDMQNGGEVSRYFCEPTSVVANQGEFRP